MKTAAMADSRQGRHFKNGPLKINIFGGVNIHIMHLQAITRVPGHQGFDPESTITARKQGVGVKESLEA